MTGGEELWLEKKLGSMRKQQRESERGHEGVGCIERNEASSLTQVSEESLLRIRRGRGRNERHVPSSCALHEAALKST